eukprot:m.542788 g.542788  ORF g.542788 m.542788 type:complete len:190 (-) comp22121_c0_seq1:3510-4079(-)
MLREEEIKQCEPPEGFGLDTEGTNPKFDAQVHLQLEKPTRRVILQDLGYSDDHCEKLSTTFAQTNCFRVLSTKGMEALAAEIDRIEDYACESARIPRVLRGGTFRSRFISDLCKSPDLTAFVSVIAGTELIPHPMEIMNGHINLAPQDKTRTVHTCMSEQSRHHQQPTSDQCMSDRFEENRLRDNIFGS